MHRMQRFHKCFVSERADEDEKSEKKPDRRMDGKNCESGIFKKQLDVFMFYVLA